MQITVSKKSQYGVDVYHPIEGDKSEIFALMVGQKTLTLRVIDHIKSLGYKVNIKQQPSEL
jgi:hypothetical protein